MFFQMFYDLIPEAREALDEAGAFIRERIDAAGAGAEARKAA